LTKRKFLALLAKYGIDVGESLMAREKEKQIVYS